MATYYESDIAAAGILSDATAVAATFATTTMILIKTNPGTPNPSLDMDQFDEADFTGYAAEAGLVLGTPFKDLHDGVWKCSAPSVNFVATAPVGPAVFVPNVIYGEVYTNAAKTEYRGCKVYDNPIAITAPGQGFEAIPQVPLLALSGRVAD